MASSIWRNTILEPRKCSHCDAKSWLFRIYPLSGMEELRSYECSACKQVDDYRVAGEPIPSWELIDPVAKTGASSRFVDSGDEPLAMV